MQEQFNFYLFIKTQHGIYDDNIYNINKNSYMIGIARISKIVFSKYQKQIFINQAGIGE